MENQFHRARFLSLFRGIEIEELSKRSQHTEHKNEAEVVPENEDSRNEKANAQPGQKRSSEHIAQQQPQHSNDQNIALCQHKQICQADAEKEDSPERKKMKTGTQESVSDETSKEYVESVPSRTTTNNTNKLVCSSQEESNNEEDDERENLGVVTKETWKKYAKIVVIDGKLVLLFSWQLINSLTFA